MIQEILVWHAPPPKPAAATASSSVLAKKYPNQGRNYNAPGRLAPRCVMSSTLAPASQQQHTRIGSIFVIIAPQQSNFLTLRCPPTGRRWLQKTPRRVMSTMSSPLTYQMFDRIVGKQCTDDVLTFPLDMTTDHPPVSPHEGSAHSAAGAHLGLQ